MGTYDRVRRVALAAVCACSVGAGIGMVAAPGAALAAEGEKCKGITGSGSSLQGAQQTKWTGLVNATGFLLGKCKEPATNPHIEYCSTGSGQGLKEFGMVGENKGEKLLPAEKGCAPKEKLDGFVGTDDPPTEELLTEAKAATTINAETVPIVAAPVATIFHPPAGCEITSAAFKVPNMVLNKLWLGEYANWKVFLEAIPVTFAGTCEVAIKHMVRSDSSGTSFAFKNYLCQIENAAEACAKWTGFVTDAPTWPAGTKAETEHGAKLPNKGSKGEAEAVKEEAGSVGYVNLANAAEAAIGFKAYAAKSTKFWAQLEGNAAKFADPANGTKGNCPTTLPKALPAEATGNPSKWSKVHLANPKDEKYPLCTLTYDIGWEKYTVANLEAAAVYGSKAMAEETGNTVRAYFEYMGFGKGQEAANIAEFYSPLPEEVKTAAKTIITKNLKFY
jgi:ABC-type phosphate transport system substrate-binding protein